MAKTLRSVPYLLTLYGISIVLGMMAAAGTPFIPAIATIMIAYPLYRKKDPALYIGLLSAYRNITESSFLELGTIWQDECSIVFNAIQQGVETYLDNREAN